MKNKHFIRMRRADHTNLTENVQYVPPRKRAHSNKRATSKSLQIMDKVYLAKKHEEKCSPKAPNCKAHFIPIKLEKQCQKVNT